MPTSSHSPPPRPDRPVFHSKRRSAALLEVASTGGQPDPNVILQINERYGVSPAEGAPLI